MSPHVIVYLDQNYLSNMAKARLGSIENENLAKFWSSLFDDLRKVALDNKIACPELEFHGAEAMYDKRLEESIRQVIDELSWGLQFRPWQSILDSQVEDAAIKFLSKKPAKREPWMVAFQTDPHAPVESRMENVLGTKGRINVHFSLPNELTEQDRQLKLEFTDEAQRLLDEYSNKPLSWPELLLQSKRSFWDGFWGKRARQFIAQGLQGDSPWNYLIALDKRKKLASLLARLQEIGINTDEANIMSFAESKELFDSPFGDINASIWAAIGEYYRQGRKPQKGDFYDVPILATVLPYCDVVTTDSFMKEIIVNFLHFDDKYKAKIFSARKMDRLAFQKFIQEL